MKGPKMPRFRPGTRMFDTSLAQQYCSSCRKRAFVFLIPPANNISKTLGIATGPWGERHFIEGIGTGLLTCSIPGQQNDRPVERRRGQGHLRAADLPGAACRLPGSQNRGCAGRRAYLRTLPAVRSAQHGVHRAQSVPGPGYRAQRRRVDVVLLAEKHRDRLHDHIKDWQEAARVRDAPGQAPDDRMGSPSISTTSCGRRRKRKRRSHPRR